MESEGGESNWAPFITVTLDAIDTFVIVFFTLEYSIRFGKDENDYILHNKPKDCTTISPSFLSKAGSRIFSMICAGRFVNKPVTGRSDIYRLATRPIDACVN